MYTKNFEQCLSFCRHCIKVCLISECYKNQRGFPGGSGGKESTCSAGDLGSIPGLGRSPGEGKSYPLQYSGLENSMDCRIHGVANKESDTTEQLSLMSRSLGLLYFK